MSVSCVADVVSANVAWHVCQRGALGSPFALSRLARASQRLRGQFGNGASVQGVAFLTDVAKLLFISRNPAMDCKSLAPAQSGNTRPAPDMFELCGCAILQSAFRHDWDTAGLIFDEALKCAANSGIPLLHEAVTGLKERFVSLPSTGSGVRSSGSDLDLLWALNRAEEHFCQGRIGSAQSAAESLIMRQPSFGWARVLLIRILFSQGDFCGARAVLSASQVGSLCPAEELAWDTLLSSMIFGWDNLPVSPAAIHISQQFRLPGYFDGLSWLLRGNKERGMSLLQGSFRAGDPFSLMMAHDPVVRFAHRYSAEESARPQHRVNSPSFSWNSEV